MTDSASPVGPGQPSPVSQRIAVVFGLGFVGTAIFLAVRAEPMDDRHWWMLLLLVGAYVLAYRTEYVHPVASTIPTGPVVVAMLFLLPTYLVPLVLVPATVIAIRVSATAGPLRSALPVELMNCWGVVGPALILHSYAPGPPTLDHWHVYLFALGSQLLIDVVCKAVQVAGSGGNVATAVRLLVWTMGMDSILALLGLSAVIAGGSSFATIAFVVVPTALIALLIQDRRELADDKEELGVAVESARGEARVDALTGLGNRRAWTEALASAQRQMVGNPDLVLAMVLADLNGLKTANDTKGHEVGDALIKAMGAAMASVIQPGETACRFGGDEYAMLALGHRDDEVLADLLRRLRAAVKAQPPIEGVVLSAAIGGASMPPEESVEEAFRIADLGVYQDKKAAYAARGLDRRA